MKIPSRLSKKFSTLLYFVVLFSVSISAQSHEIERYYASNNVAPLLIVFHGEPHLSFAKNLKTKVEKTKYVFTEINRYHHKILQEFLTSNPSLHYKSYPIANSIVAEINYNQYLSIKDHTLIHSIVLDESQPRLEVIEFRQEINSGGRSLPTTWGIKDSKADSVWQQGYLGKGIVIGGQDTGYNAELGPIKKTYRGYINDTLSNHNYHWHDAIREKNDLNTTDENPCGFDVKKPCDDNNHGTHTMGTMVGRDTNEIIGVAPEASWIGCRNMDRGWGKPSTYIECFEWFLAPTDLNNLNPKPELAPDVINNSWGCPTEEGCNQSNWEVMRRVLVTLKAAGIFVVVSAGNSGPNCNTVNAPAAFFKESFSIGAHASSGLIAGFSSRGTSIFDSTLVKPDITAPGVGVRSILRNGSYSNASGTSMAGPHVAGVVALILSAAPSLKGQVEIVENILRESARPTKGDKICNDVDTLAIPNNTFGFGKLDAMRALKLALDYQTTDVENKDDNLLEVYPNPVSDYVLLKGLGEGEYEYIFYDYTGKAVEKGHSKELILYLTENIFNGLYLLKISQGRQIYTRKVLIRR
jgi:serine protease AprX